MFKSSFAVAVLLVFAVSTANGAIVVDLTTAGAFATPTADMGGMYRVLQVPDQSTGTGLIEPFVRIQDNNNEHGYNTDLPVQFDTKAGLWTHALSLSDIPLVDVGGTSYRQFLLDINQSSGSTNNLLSLNQIQIFQSASDMLHTSIVAATATTAPIIGFAGATEVFRMNSAAFGASDEEILLNYSLNPGSGAGDMYLYVLDSDFNAAGDFVIFYSQFGLPPGASDSNDGFEEWAVLTDDGGDPQEPGVPEPATLVIWSLLGAMAVCTCHLRRRRRAA